MRTGPPCAGHCEIGSDTRGEEMKRKLETEILCKKLDKIFMESELQI